jgi:phosphate transport system permease protein
MNSWKPDAPVIAFDPRRLQAVQKPVEKRIRKDRWFERVCVVVTVASVLVLVVLLATIFGLGMKTVTPGFLTRPPSPDPTEAGFFPAIIGNIWLMVIVLLGALPIGIATAIILEEYVPKNRFFKHLHSIAQANITNLAGVPSVVYGIIGLTLFVSMFMMHANAPKTIFEIGVKYYDQFYNEAGEVLLVPVDSNEAPETKPEQGMRALVHDGTAVALNVIGEDEPFPEDAAVAVRTVRRSDIPGRISEESWYHFRIPFGRSVLAGGLTLILVVLPIIITASQEALRAVPFSFREAAWGLGATRWNTVWKITLPAAIPGIMTGTILALSRAIGEAAPLLMIAGIVYISNPPGNLMDDFTAMPLQIYNWAQRPQAEFHRIAAGGIIVLLVVLLCFNAAAVYIRQKYSKYQGM